MIEGNACLKYFRIGSILCSVSENGTQYAEALAACYGVEILRKDPKAPAEIMLSITEEAENVSMPQDKFLMKHIESGWLIKTDPVICTVFNDEKSGEYQPLVGEVTVRLPGMDITLIGYHLWIIVNRILLLLEAIVIHASAIELNGSLNIFCGHKGAGKSTLSVFLGQQGGKVLAEDRILLRKKPSGFYASGCSDNVKIMAKSEEFLLPGQLEMEQSLVSNIPKKVFKADQFFTAIPHVDMAPKRILFNQVGDRYSLINLKRNEALLQMIDRTADIYRFSEKTDYNSFLTYLSEFIKGIDCYKLDLSTNLQELTQLVKSLEELDNS